MQQEHWFAFHTFRNGKQSFLLRLRNDGKQSYIPVRVDRTIAVNYDEELVKTPVFPSLVFVKADMDYVITLRQDFFSLAAPYTEPGTSTPAVIPDKEMEIFRFVLEKGCDRLDPCDEQLCKGDKVRVLDGIFKGAEGYILRIKGTRRFVVSIHGVAAVATAYIPQNMLEKVE